MTYDAWKSCEPDEPEEWASCDACGRDKPWRQMRLTSTGGRFPVEVWCCDECLGVEPEDDDGPELTPEECAERTREILAPCSDYSRSRGCTCSMEPFPHWADEPPEPVINRNCPLHGSPPLYDTLEERNEDRRSI